MEDHNEKPKSVIYFTPYKIVQRVLCGCADVRHFVIVENRKHRQLSCHNMLATSKSSNSIFQKDKNYNLRRSREEKSVKKGENGIRKVLSSLE